MGCPKWEYNPQRHLATPRVAWELQKLRERPLEYGARTIADTRPFHGNCFEGLTPKGFEYYAGNYRGSEHECLKDRPVVVTRTERGVTSVVLECCPPGDVTTAMSLLRVATETELANLRLKPDDPARVSAIVSGVAAFLEWFCRIHPYLNGNGHAARFAACAYFLQFGLQPVRLTVNDSPPNFGDYIQAYREGNPDPLEDYLYGVLRSPTSPAPTSAPTTPGPE